MFFAKGYKNPVKMMYSFQQALQNAEQKVQQLVEKNGELLEKSFDLDE